MILGGKRKKCSYTAIKKTTNLYLHILICISVRILKKAEHVALHHGLLELSCCTLIFIYIVNLNPTCH